MIAIKTDGDLEKVAGQLADMEEIDYVVITAGSFDVLAEVVCEDDDHLLEILGRVRAVPFVTSTETFVYLKLRKQTYSWGTRRHPPTPSATHRTPPSAISGCTSPACPPTRTVTFP